MTGKKIINLKSVGVAAIAVLTLSLLTIFASPASAGHNGADVSYETVECGETTFTTGIVDPNGSHKSHNMYLVVSANGNTQYVKIPTDGTEESITAGPFTANTTVSWNVFGGGERDYDQPLWNGYGTASFSADIGAYATSQGGYSWVLDGPETPNPFVNWNEFDVEGCPVPADEEDETPGTAAVSTDGNTPDKTEATGQVEAKPVGGVNAGGASSTAIASLFGLLTSAGVLGFGALRGFVRLGE